MLDNNPDFKLSVLVAYYPPRIPDPRHRFPGGVQVLVHLAGESYGVVKRSQMVGIQGKTRVGRRRLDPGVGPGGTLRMAFPAFAYDGLEPGFAERDLDEFDSVAAELAWDRSLAAVRRAFRWEGNVMGVAEENAHSESSFSHLSLSSSLLTTLGRNLGKFYAKDEERLMRTYSTAHTPHVTFMPTLVGGAGSEEIAWFYGDFFLDCNPPSLEVTLVSRTAAANRVVDELHVSFDHTQDMPWILPGIPATGRHVEVMLVTITALRGGKIVHEHVYWDQASVLFQVGLLNPDRMVPRSMRDRGVERLPVVGHEPASRIIDGGYDEVEGEADNHFLDDYDDGEDDDDDDGEEGDYEDEDGFDDEEDDEEDEEEEEGEEEVNDVDAGVQSRVENGVEDEYDDDEVEEEEEDAGEYDEEDEEVDEEVDDKVNGEAVNGGAVNGEAVGDLEEDNVEQQVETKTAEEPEEHKDTGAVNGHVEEGEPSGENGIPKEEEPATAADDTLPGAKEEEPEVKQPGKKKRSKKGRKQTTMPEPKAANQATVEDTEDRGD